MALLDGKVALVSGAGPGLGRDIAGLRSPGCDGRGGGPHRGQGRGHRRRDRGLGAKALALRLDVCDADSCRGTVERVVDTFGRLDILVNNAFTPVIARFADADLDDWRRTMDVNLFGTLQLTQACVA